MTNASRTAAFYAQTINTDRSIPKKKQQPLRVANSLQHEMLTQTAEKTKMRRLRDGKCYSVNTTAVNTAQDGRSTTHRGEESTQNRYMVVETIGS